MNDLAIMSAKFVLWAMVAGFAIFWLWAENRRGKVDLALSAVAGLVLVLIFVKLTGEVYSNPRPFVDQGIEPLIPHDPDNGFPSNHASAAGLIAGLVLLRRWRIGLAFAVGAVVVAWGRVATYVHHVLDVSVGVGIGLLAAYLGTMLIRWALPRSGLLRTPLARWWLRTPR